MRESGRGWLVLWGILVSPISYPRLGVRDEIGRGPILRGKPTET
jgi:hypothetical protein